MINPRQVLLPAMLLAGLSGPAFTAESPVREDDLEQVTVIGLTPLGGATQDAADIAGSTQSTDAATIARSHAADVSAFLSRRFGSVHVNENQGNALQPDLSFRGFTASPLLGTPQGISVYLDGVRLNQPFGDVVSWDLIPRNAIARMDLTSGANPLFGANTLGGALSLRTKDGRQAAGTQLDASDGSHDRRQFNLETGGSADNGLHWYATANRFRDAGWRAESPSDARQAFAKLGWHGERTDVALSGAHAKSTLSGNGLQDVRLLAQDYASAYTLPDETRNRSGLLNLTARHEMSEALTLSGNAWYRRLRTSTYNGDINEGALDQTLYQPNATERDALAAAYYSGFPASGESAANTPFPKWRCIANVLLNDEPNEKCNGLINRTALAQRNAGAALQLEARVATGTVGHQITAGVAQDDSRMHFLQSAQFGYLDATRRIIGATGIGAYADGTQNSENAFDARVDLDGQQRTQGVYVADAMAITPRLHANVMARYDSTRVRNRDALTPGGGTGSLDGDHRFSRLNPAAGFVVRMSPALSAYSSYGESSRAPSSIELGCADPAAPCRLPNSMAGDPPLRQVVAKTLELGLRGQRADLRWSAGAFRAMSQNDILFVADDQAGFGYFRNVDRTRRQGIELALDGKASMLSWGLHATWLDATFQTTEVLNAGSNRSNDAAVPGLDGTITVHAGDRLPQTPRQILKAYAEWQASPRLSINVDASYTGGSLARGNENGLHRPDGLYYFGPGSIGGYALANLGAEWKATRHLTAWLQVNNLLDRRYASAAQLGATGLRTDGSFIARPFPLPVLDGERPVMHSTFVAPGQPRAVLAGLRLRFDGR